MAPSAVEHNPRQMASYHSRGGEHTGTGLPGLAPRLCTVASTSRPLSNVPPTASAAGTCPRRTLEEGKGPPPAEAVRPHTTGGVNDSQHHEGFAVAVEGTPPVTPPVTHTLPQTQTRNLPEQPGANTRPQASDPHAKAAAAATLVSLCALMQSQARGLRFARKHMKCAHTALACLDRHDHTREEGGESRADH